jgi:beta-lactamase superfamily II metal-dependent hydrolase
VSEERVIDVDLADVWDDAGRKKLRRTLAWGDQVTVVAQTTKHIQVEFAYFVAQKDGSVLPKVETGFIVPRKVKPAEVTRKASANKVLRVNFVDVQQGDGAVIESPDGKVVLVDGGDNQLFARYLAGRYRDTSDVKPKEIDCIVVTHGDGDHFNGLTEIHESETHAEKLKQLFIHPRRVYHNGLVKRPSKRDNKAVPEREMLGATVTTDDGVFIVGLEDDPRDVPETEMNQPFKLWRRALNAWTKRGPIEVRRLQFGDTTAFDFFNKGKLRIDVLGPITQTIDGGPALRFLGEPRAGLKTGHESLTASTPAFSGLSASHTINGHSIVFRLSYGKFSYLFTGDLNEQASTFLVDQDAGGAVTLESEVLKVPHHGSADFSAPFFEAVSPVVSIVSSGDESRLKEYIHPRATLMGSLGRWSRIEEPLIFVTELVAFFEVEGKVRLVDEKAAKKRGSFFGFSRAAFGLVKTRTDGERLLVFTDSGNVSMKEAYAYEMDADGIPQPSEVLRV